MTRQPHGKLYRSYRGYNLSFEYNPRSQGVRLFAYRAGKINFTARGMTEEECIGLLDIHMNPPKQRHKFSKYVANS